MTGSANAVKGVAFGGLAAIALFSNPAGAATTITWANLTSYDGTSTVQGTIPVGSGVGVTYTGSGNGFVQTNGTGTDYWTGPAFTFDGVNHAPTTNDIIALSQGGTKTITFSKPVSNVFMALVSWNGNTPTFDQPFNIVSQGCGYFGCGSFGTTGNPPFTSFVGNGELHGIIEFTGTFSQISFTDSSEYWHGFDVGIGGVATRTGTPEAATWAMMILGFGFVGGVMRRGSRHKAAVHYSFT
jgi:hypothetical protein